MTLTPDALIRVARAICREKCKPPRPGSSLRHCPEPHICRQCRDLARAALNAMEKNDD